MTDDAYPLTFCKEWHKPGCDGQLYRVQHTVCVDVLGRVGNGGIVAHQYRCNLRTDGCAALVFVTEKAVRLLAVSSEVRP